MSATRYSPQEAFNLSNGTAPTARSLQEIANISDGSSFPTQYSFQEILNTNLGVHSTCYSEQEALFLTLQADLSLTPPYTQYSIQELLNLAYTGGVTVEEALDDDPIVPTFLMETGDALLTEDSNTLTMEG